MNRHIFKVLPSKLPPSFKLTIAICKQGAQTFAQLSHALEAKYSELVANGDLNTIQKAGKMVLCLSDHASTEDQVWYCSVQKVSATPQAHVTQSLKRQNPDDGALSKTGLKKLKKDLWKEAASFYSGGKGGGKHGPTPLLAAIMRNGKNAQVNHNFNQTKGPNQKNLKDIQCHCCGRYGHTQASCFNLATKGWNWFKNSGKGKGKQPKGGKAYMANSPYSLIPPQSFVPPQPSTETTTQLVTTPPTAFPTFGPQAGWNPGYWGW